MSAAMITYTHMSKENKTSLGGGYTVCSCDRVPPIPVFCTSVSRLLQKIFTLSKVADFDAYSLTNNTTLLEYKCTSKEIKYYRCKICNIIWGPSSSDAFILVYYFRLSYNML
jgi:hypothetical protein